MNNYNLDSAGGTKYEKIAGNLTGVGSIPISGVNVEYDNALSFDINISNADHALYVGKEKGRNQVIGYRDCK